jgi:ABC-type transporter Mla subunit MlaD
MPIPVWIALAVLLVLTTVGAFHLFHRARALFRTLSSFGEAADETMGALTQSLDALERSSEEFNSSQPKLEASIARLKRSLAQASVLLAAAQDVRASVSRLAAVYPRK